MFIVVPFLLCASQIYWFWKLRGWVWRALPAGRARILALAGIVALYLLMLAYNAGWIGGRSTPVNLTPGEALLGAPFTLWIASSLVAFLLILLFYAGVSVIRAAGWLFRRPQKRGPALAIESPERRVFLERTAAAVAAAPFVGGAYGLLHGRLNLETPLQPILLPKLPKAFEGFRIAQLSDIHIGPFMTGEEIRRYAGIANAMKPHLIVLTGDFVTWDGSTQQAVVEALSGLKAPFGVYGCLGNHDAWAGVEDSITRLFAQAGIRILRGQNVPLALDGEELNLIGVDYYRERRGGPANRGMAARSLHDIQGLVSRERVNLLLSHHPDTFDDAAAMGIDLSLAGHTHGGQVALEFISPGIAPSRLVTPYVAGHFQKTGGQLYVNRGIGTIGVPIRIGAPPEITLFELKRA